jgi:hypothetical protein
MLCKKGCILLETNASLKELLFETDNAPKNSHERQEVSSFTTTPHFCKFFLKVRFNSNLGDMALLGEGMQEEENFFDCFAKKLNF